MDDGALDVEELVALEDDPTRRVEDRFGLRGPAEGEGEVPGPPPGQIGVLPIGLRGEVEPVQELLGAVAVTAQDDDPRQEALAVTTGARSYGALGEALGEAGRVPRGRARHPGA